MLPRALPQLCDIGRHGDEVIMHPASRSRGTVHAFELAANRQPCGASMAKASRNWVSRALELAIPDVTDEEWDAFHAVIGEE